MADSFKRSAVEEVVSLENGKYRLIRYKNGALSALRHGEPWRDLTGDKLVGALLDRLLGAEAHLAEVNRKHDELHGIPPPGCEWPFRPGRQRCRECGDPVMSDLTDICYRCAQAAASKRTKE